MRGMIRNRPCLSGFPEKMCCKPRPEPCMQPPPPLPPAAATCRSSCPSIYDEDLEAYCTNPTTAFGDPKKCFGGRLPYQDKRAIGSRGIYKAACVHRSLASRTPPLASLPVPRYEWQPLTCMLPLATGTPLCSEGSRRAWCSSDGRTSASRPSTPRGCVA